MNKKLSLFQACFMFLPPTDPSIREYYTVDHLPTVALVPERLFLLASTLRCQCCCLVFFVPDASQVSPPPPACGLLCVSGAGVGRACQRGRVSGPPLSLTVCAAGGGRAGGRPSGSRNSCRAWPPSGYGGAGPGRRCWRRSWSSAGTCGA